MELDLSLIPASDDPPFAGGAEYQKQLWIFEKSLKQDKGLVVDSGMEAFLSAQGGIFLGDFSIKIIAILGPFLVTAVGAWLHGRYGRKVRLKVGEIEAEAQTVEEVEKLLKRAEEIQQRKQPKVIHELIRRIRRILGKSAFARNFSLKGRTGVPGKTGDAARFWEHSSDHARQRGAKLGSVPRFFFGGGRKITAHMRDTGLLQSL